MVSVPPARRSGFSLIELLVVLSITAVLAAVALPNFSTFIAKQRVKGAAMALQLSLVNARSEAVRRNGNVTLTPVGGDWKSGWQMTDATGTLIQSQNPIAAATLTTSSTAVVYQTSGRIFGGAAQTFTIAASSTPCVYTVRVDTGGRPYVSKSAGC